MSKHRDVGLLMKEALESAFPLKRNELGSDAHLAKKGFHFDVETYAVGEGLGQLCILRMKAALGLMKMETAVLSVTGRDLPLFNLDWVSAFGKETLMAELYDTQLQALPQETLARFQALKDRDRELNDRQAGQHWYDPIRYPCSYDKTGKGLTERFNGAAREYAAAYVQALAAAAPCDGAAKGEKVREFAETLFRQGGPAVDQVKKLFGEETARRLILGHMYGASRGED